MTRVPHTAPLSTLPAEDGTLVFARSFCLGELTFPTLPLPRYAMERTSTHISLWFWSRTDASVPAEVKNGSGAVSPATWGTPYANFVNNSCDFGSHFGPENIIINLTLCKWMNKVFSSLIDLLTERDFWDSVSNRRRLGWELGHLSIDLPSNLCRSCEQ